MGRGRPPPNKGRSFTSEVFPEGERDRIADKEFSFGLHSAMVPQTSFTEHQLCCQFDRRYWMDIRGLGLPPVGYELSGASGGPMLQPIFKDGEWDWWLVGVISEGVMAEDFERITAVRAHFILPDGRLSPPAPACRWRSLAICVSPDNRRASLPLLPTSDFPATSAAATFCPSLSAPVRREGIDGSYAFPGLDGAGRSVAERSLWPESAYREARTQRFVDAFTSYVR